MSPVQRLIPNIPKSLANASAKYIPSRNTLNLYEARIRNPEKPHDSKKIRFFGWERPGIRIVNSVTWLLSNAKEQGLGVREDGFVRMEEVLRHPQFSNLDFPRVESAIREYRALHLRLIYAPYCTYYGHATGVQTSCWWIKLDKSTKRKLTISADQRVVSCTEVPHMVFRTSTFKWPEFRNRGIARGLAPHISFMTDITIPIDYQGDTTYIRLNSNKAYATLPLYRSRFLERKRGSKLREIVTTPVRTVLPDVFETAMRVAVKRIPLLIRDEPHTTKLGGEREPLSALNEEQVVTLQQSGIDALRKFGFAHVVEQSQLFNMLEEQQRERQQHMEQERKEEVQEILETLRKTRVSSSSSITCPPSIESANGEMPPSR